jgi:nitrogen fixation/metabolism regulation signal transduction histidine kinase
MREIKPFIFVVGTQTGNEFNALVHDEALAYFARQGIDAYSVDGSYCGVPEVSILVVARIGQDVDVLRAHIRAIAWRNGQDCWLESDEDRTTKLVYVAAGVPDCYLGTLQAVDSNVVDGYTEVNGIKYGTR